MSSTIYMVSCNFITHAACPLKLMAYKYNELQMPFATQKLSYKANCKTPLFLIVLIHILSYFKALVLSAMGFCQ
jgi:hypothetical protein